MIIGNIIRDHPFLSYLLLGSVVFVVSFVVLFITSLVMGKRFLSLIRAIIIAVITVIIMIIINNLNVGFAQRKGNELIPRDVEVKTLTLTAEVLSLRYEEYDEGRSFKFILDSQEIESEDWESKLSQLLSLYEELKSVNLENVQDIPYNLVVSLKDLANSHGNIVFTGLSHQEKDK